MSTINSNFLFRGDINKSNIAIGSCFILIGIIDVFLASIEVVNILMIEYKILTQLNNRICLIFRVVLEDTHNIIEFKSKIFNSIGFESAKSCIWCVRDFFYFQNSFQAIIFCECMQFFTGVFVAFRCLEKPTKLKWNIVSL